MKITETQIKHLELIAETISKETLIDDDVSGGYIPEPFDLMVKTIYEITEQCHETATNELQENEQIQSVSNNEVAVCRAPSKILPCSHFYSNRCLHPGHCNYKQTDC